MHFASSCTSKVLTVGRNVSFVSLHSNGFWMKHTPANRPCRYPDFVAKRSVSSSDFSQSDEESKPRSIYIGNLPADINEREITQFLAMRGCSTVQHVSMPYDIMRRADGVEVKRKRGYAFIRFDSFEIASDAVQKLNGADCKGSLLRVNLRTPARGNAPNLAGKDRQPSHPLRGGTPIRSPDTPPQPPTPAAAEPLTRATSPPPPSAPKEAAAPAAPSSAPAPRPEQAAATRMVQPKRSGRQVPPFIATSLSARPRSRSPSSPSPAPPSSPSPRPRHPPPRPSSSCACDAGAAGEAAGGRGRAGGGDRDRHDGPRSLGAHGRPRGAPPLPVPSLQVFPSLSETF